MDKIILFSRESNKILYKDDIKDCIKPGNSIVLNSASAGCMRQMKVVDKPELLIDDGYGHLMDIEMIKMIIECHLSKDDRNYVFVLEGFWYVLLYKIYDFGYTHDLHNPQLHRVP